MFAPFLRKMTAPHDFSEGIGFTWRSCGITVINRFAGIGDFTERVEYFRLCAFSDLIHFVLKIGTLVHDAVSLAIVERLLLSV